MKYGVGPTSALVVAVTVLACPIATIRGLPDRLTAKPLPAATAVPPVHTIKTMTEPIMNNALVFVMDRMAPLPRIIAAASLG
jgi:hypothetical protein